MYNSVFITLLLTSILTGCVTKQNTDTPVVLDVAEELPFELALDYIHSSMDSSSFQLDTFRMMDNIGCTRVTEKLAAVDTMHRGEMTEYWSYPLAELTAHAVKMDYTTLGEGSVFSYGVFLEGGMIAPMVYAKCFVYFRHFVDMPEFEQPKEVLSDSPSMHYGESFDEKKVLNEMSRMMTALKSLGVKTQSVKEE